jgi:hypothetical protein
LPQPSGTFWLADENRNIPPSPHVKKHVSVTKSAIGVKSVWHLNQLCCDETVFNKSETCQPLPETAGIAAPDKAVRPAASARPCRVPAAPNRLLPAPFAIAIQQ